MPRFMPGKYAKSRAIDDFNLSGKRRSDGDVTRAARQRRARFAHAHRICLPVKETRAIVTPPSSGGVTLMDRALVLIAAATGAMDILR